MSGAIIYRFCDTLIAAAHERRGIDRWPPGVAHRAVEAELKARGYRIVQGERGQWFAEKEKS